MAYFKLALLTSQFEDNKSFLLQDVISEFNTQENVYNSKKAEEDPSVNLYTLETSTDYNIEKRKYSFCYSYDEKFSLTQNAQKTLSFNMDKFVIKEDLREENPFARNIIIGSQLLLVDQYGNNYFFTVKNINYDIKEINITYKISCQDTFSYQLTRQNAGYTIDNNPTEVDFIGAKDIDWWVTNKIIPECHISYSYLLMNQGLYEATDGSYKIFNDRDNLTNVKRIIKDAYSRDKDKDLYETIPFSCSGSNANAALISLGETLDLQIKTFEHIDGLKYFWFEPKKNSNRIGGLVYSPYNSIQSFGLSHKGDSLTTIMNVEGPTYDDELITLIPELTPHFANFINSDSWNSQYRKGMFLDQCAPQHYILNDRLDNDQTVDNQSLYYTTTWNQTAGQYVILSLSNTPDFDEESITYNGTTGFLYIKLFADSEHNSTFKLNPLFTKVSFNSGGVSTLSCETPDYINTSCDSRTHLWSLAIIKNNAEIASFSDGENCEEYLKDAAITVWMKIFIGTGRGGDAPLTKQLTFISFKPLLSFSREVSQEDLDFAEAAEECPWLENKLIDFNYFLENKMISPDEYRNLMNLFTQDLRIINGQLMFYAKAYYKALHERTQLIADLTNKLDALGAAAHSDITMNLRLQGQVDGVDITSFSNAYKGLVSSNITEKNKLLNYNDILTSYFNKLFNSEQRFLKNIKKFKDYFNSVPITWADPSTAFYQYKLEITNPSSISYIINSSVNTSNLINAYNMPYIQTGDRAGTPFYPIYKVDTQSSNKILGKYYPITAENFNDYYIRNPISDSEGKAGVISAEKYNSKWTYYNKSNDELIPDEYIKRAIIRQNASSFYYRVVTTGYESFSSASSAITTINNIFKEDLTEEYKSNFPVETIYIEPGTNNEKQILLIKEDNDNKFYKLNLFKKWKKDPNKIRWDVYGGDKRNQERNFIYGSTIADKGLYASNTIEPTMGANFLYAAANSNRKYRKNAWFKTITKDQYINKNCTYKVFEIQDSYDLSSITSFFNSTAMRDTIAYWIIYNTFEDCDLVGKKIKDVETSTLQTLLSGDYATPKSGSNFIWTPVTGSSSRCPFTKDFIIVQIADYTLQQCTSSSEYERNKVYCDQYDRPINFGTKNFPSSITYKNSGGTDVTVTVNATTNPEQANVYHRVKAFIHPKDSSNENDKIFHLTGETYYEQVGSNEFIQIYTVPQLPSNSSQNRYNYKYVNPYQITFDYLTPYETKITVPLLKVDITRDSNNNIIDFTKSKTQDYIVYFAEGEVHSDPIQYYKGNNVALSPNDPYPTVETTDVYQQKTESIEDESIAFKLTKHHQADLKSKTNGQLWDLYERGIIGNSVITDGMVASIQAQLEQYWQQAYTASLYCKYFLPESWLPVYNKDQNLFFDDIIGWDNDTSIDTKGNIYLKNIYLPDVSIYMVDNSIVLPKYYITRGFAEEGSVDSQGNIHTSDFSSNLVIKKFISALGEDINIFSAVESGTMTYYYVADEDEGSGCTWKKLMLQKVGQEYRDYTGHYELAYHLIQKYYLPLELKKYDELKKAQRELWDTLYTTYGYLMLEQNYKNDTATTSPELMTLAKYAFKDYTAPERQYNITVIDATSLKGYKGEEIRVGDGIQIDAQAYYNEYDQIFKSLSQYLFVTDISYTLRSPTDISLTVNSIKYQDKLIQRLVKLIK